MHAKFCSENLKERDYAKDIGVDGKIIMEEIGSEGMDWMQLAQNREKWRVL